MEFRNDFQNHTSILVSAYQNRRFQPKSVWQDVCQNGKIPAIFRLASLFDEFTSGNVIFIQVLFSYLEAKAFLESGKRGRQFLER